MPKGASVGVLDCSVIVWVAVGADRVGAIASGGLLGVGGSLAVQLTATAIKNRMAENFPGKRNCFGISNQANVTDADEIVS